MQQTFQINTGELNDNFINSVRALFGERRIKIVVEEVEEIPVPDQKEMFRRSEAVRLSLKNVKVDPTLDLSALANEVNL